MEYYKIWMRKVDRGPANKNEGEIEEISQLIESWHLADRQRILDTSLSVSELNAFGEREKTPQAPTTPTRCPPPRPPETYRRQSQPVRAHTEEPPRRETRESSRGPSSKLLGFLRRPESKKKQPESSEMNGSTRGGGMEDQEWDGKNDHEKELLEVAAELKWLIDENSRQLTELCHEEARLTGRLPQECIPECKADHPSAPLKVITRSVTYQNPTNSPSEMSITPRSAVSSNFPGGSQNGISPSSESWSLRRLPPVATDCYDGSVASKTPSLSELISSLTHNQKDFHTGPDPQLYQHIKVNQWCEVVRHSKLRSIEAGGCDPQETVNRKRGTQPSSGSPQLRRGAAMIPESNRQRSEPPRIGKIFINGNLQLPRIEFLEHLALGSSLVVQVEVTPFET
ncbi:hypothetical protein ACTXT7_010907 [Hymenolepis weldensis]